MNIPSYQKHYNISLKQIQQMVSVPETTPKDINDGENMI